jgi:DNA-binding Xre family transcriptional regulator
MKVQKRVVEYVSSHGIRQSFIADKTGLTRTKVSRLLNLTQTMTLDDFVKFCKALHKSPNDFISDDGE